MDGCEAVRDFGADGASSITAMGIAHDKNLVWIHVSEKQKLLNEVFYQGIHVNVIKSVPGVVGSAQGQVKITASFPVVLVIALHLFPLAIVHFFRSPTASMHGDEERPAVFGPRAH